jgi:hypothetical protein
MKKLFILALCYISVMCMAQQNVKQSLLVTHVVAGTGKDAASFKQKIYAYHFLNGSFIGRDELIGFDGKKDGKDYIRTDRGKNTIYKDRYLITGIGNIIDLVDKKILYDGRGNVVRVNNDSVVFYTNDAFKGKYYSVYDLKAQQYKEVKNLLFKPKLGKDVEYDKTAVPFKINYYPEGKPKVLLVGDAGYGQQETKDNKTVPDPPMHWIDNNNFVYTYFNKDNTEISFYKVNIDTKQSTLVGKLPITKEIIPASFVKINTEQLLLTYGNRQIFVDLDNNAVSFQDASRPEHGFTYDFKADNKGRIVRVYGKETGKYHFETRNFEAGENIAAFVKEMIIGADSYQQGLMVWNSTKKAWVSVDADEVLALVGWVNY